MSDIVVRRQIGLKAAAAAVEGAVAAARQCGSTVAVAVVDPDGALVAFARADGGAATLGEFAIDKAYTAATARCSTRDLFEVMDAAPALRLGFANRPRLMVWGGGVPISVDGEVIGAIGVSGGSEDDDIACAMAGIAASGLRVSA